MRDGLGSSLNRFMPTLVQTDVFTGLRKVDAMFMYMYVFVAAMILGWSAPGLAQFIDRGNRVEVKKGTVLCSKLPVDGARGDGDRNRIFWRVTSPMRANGTQTVSAVIRESVYDRRSGNTTSVETLYDEEYATFFQRASRDAGVLVMISPQDGSEQATVGLCAKAK